MLISFDVPRADLLFQKGKHTVLGGGTTKICSKHNRENVPCQVTPGTSPFTGSSYRYSGLRDGIREEV